ncbi:MAG: ribulose-phosphate 3-epimerase [Treponema sp.]|jgi:ribulose-phosphate 3-epimerase|nr:ribulose-phosphate 3-epimerase [Treponema sp.]
MAVMKILCPSILNLPIDGLKEEIVKINGSGIDIFHIDIMDGMFVPNFGMAVREIDLIRSLTDKPLDCHMMVMEPRRYINMLADHGIDIIYIHPEAELIPSETIDQIRALGKLPGIVINPWVSLEQVKEMLPIVDYVMLMGVNPGYAGRDYLPYITPKAKVLNDYRVCNNLSYKIVLDGGADEKVITELYRDCGIEGFVLGKQVFFFQDKPYKECVDYVRAL